MPLQATDKLLSVIVPAYNIDGYLPRCLSSLTADGSTLSRLDVIVVNDGSTDGTGALAHACANEHPESVRVIDKANGHYGSCVNAALPSARGVYVKILDGDDAADPAGLAALVSALAEEAASESPADCVITDYVEVDSDGSVLRSVHYGYADGFSFPAETEPRLGTDHLDVHALTFRTDMLRSMEYRQTEGMPFTDAEWYTEPFAEVARVRYVPQVSARYLVARADQSMAAANYLKSFHVIPALAMGLVRRSPLRKGCAGYGLFRARIKFLLGVIYTKALLSTSKDRPKWDLAPYDAQLAEVDAELHEALYGLTTSSFHFHYVAEWRRRHTTHTFLYAAYWLVRSFRALAR